MMKDKIKYKIVYADPPWKYNSRANHKTRFRGGAYGHYKLMSMNEIKKLPIPDITDDNAALFMWCTFPYLDDQIKLFEYWGFKYRTVAFNWVKLNPKGYDTPDKIPKGKGFYCYKGKYHTVFFGVGYYTKSNSEVCLLGIKGRMKPISNKVSSIIIAPRREHSRKPDEARERIVELYGDLPRIELFGREKIEGWDVLGNEINEKDILVELTELSKKLN